jgi:hypothetical protein
LTAVAVAQLAPCPKTLEAPKIENKAITQINNVLLLLLFKPVITGEKVIDLAIFNTYFFCIKLKFN